MTRAEARPKRADARANRERLLDAAGEMFAERGIEVPIQAIADRAQLGSATLYRNFPDRDALVLGLMERARASFERVGARAMAADSGWDAIVAYVDGTAAMYLEFPWLAPVRARARRIAPAGEREEAAIHFVIERAWAEGSLRTDIEATDVVFVPSLLAGLVELPEPMRSVVLRRQRDIVLDGLRADGVPRRAPGGDGLSLDALRAHVRSSVEESP